MLQTNSSGAPLREINPVVLLSRLSAFCPMTIQYKRNKRLWVSTLTTNLQIHSFFFFSLKQWAWYILFGTASLEKGRSHYFSPTRSVEKPGTKDSTKELKYCA